MSSVCNVFYLVRYRWHSQLKINVIAYLTTISRLKWETVVLQIDIGWIFFLCVHRTNNQFSDKFEFLDNLSRVASNQQSITMFRAIQSLFPIQKVPLSVASLIQPSNQITNGLLSRSYHMLSMKSQPNPIGGSLTSSSSSSSSTILTSTIVPQLTQSCGFKVVGKVHRRCRDCNMMVINGVIYNHCKTHPRHKQRQRITKKNNTWTLTAVQTGTKRPWWMTINYHFKWIFNVQKKKEINNVQKLSLRLHFVRIKNVKNI